jgi:hypothetical protein
MRQGICCICCENGHEIDAVTAFVTGYEKYNRKLALCQEEKGRVFSFFHTREDPD